MWGRLSDRPISAQTAQLIPNKAANPQQRGRKTEETVKVQTELLLWDRKRAAEKTKISANLNKQKANSSTVIWESGKVIEKIISSGYCS